MSFIYESSSWSTLTWTPKSHCPLSNGMSTPTTRQTWKQHNCNQSYLPLQKQKHLTDVHVYLFCNCPLFSLKVLFTFFFNITVFKAHHQTRIIQKSTDGSKYPDRLAQMKTITMVGCRTSERKYPMASNRKETRSWWYTQVETSLRCCVRSIAHCSAHLSWWQRLAAPWFAPWFSSPWSVPGQEDFLPE